MMNALRQWTMPAESIVSVAMVSGKVSTEIKAERRLGEMLRDMPKAGGCGIAGPGRGNGVPIENPVLSAPTLAEIGIDKKVSMRAQRLAALLVSASMVSKQVSVS